MEQYRKKPVVIQAVQWDGTEEMAKELIHKKLINAEISYASYNTETFCLFKIKTLEGTMLVSKDDYIIRGVQGEYYPCKPDIFQMTYEKIY